MKSRLPRAAVPALLALFLAPVLLAVLMHRGTLEFPAVRTRNHGLLLIPPVAIDWAGFLPHASAAPLSGRWVMLYPLPPNCDANCIGRATGLRQVQRAAGKDRARTAVALLTDDPADPELRRRLMDIHAEFILLHTPAAGAKNSLQRAKAGMQVDGEPIFFLVDPLGNIMMAYTAGHTPEELNRDLRRLLTWSKLDKKT